MRDPKGARNFLAWAALLVAAASPGSAQVLISTGTNSGLKMSERDSLPNAWFFEPAANQILIKWDAVTVASITTSGFAGGGSLLTGITVGTVSASADVIINSNSDNVLGGDIVFKTAGSGEKARLTNSGTFGIGTTSPQGADTVLHVRGGSIRLDRPGGNPYVDFFEDATNRGAIAADASSMRFNVWTKEAMRFLPGTLNAGFGGTTSPSALIHASSGSLSSGYYLLKLSTGIDAAGAEVFSVRGDGQVDLSYSAGDTFPAGAGSTTPGLTIHNASTVDGTVSMLKFDHTRTSGARQASAFIGALHPDHASGEGLLVFGIKPNGAQEREVMRIGSTSDVSIGTRTAAARLHVSSDAPAGASSIFLVSTGTQAGGEVFVVKGNGAVGIGKTDPGWTLQVKGGQMGIINDNNANGPSVNIENTGTGGTQFRLVSTGGSDDAGSGKLNIRSSAVSHLMVMAGSSGNVGIGVSTPQSKLDVEGGAAIGASYSGTNAAPTNGLLVQGDVSIGTPTAQARLHVSSDTPAATSYLFLVSSGTQAGGDLFLVRGDGRVGIGTTVPGYNVHVSSGSGAVLLNLERGSQAQGDVGLQLYSSSNFGRMYYPSGSTTLTFSNSGDALSITSGGNVGIGTTNPVHRLTVHDGDIWISTTSSGRGIVFENSSKQTSAGWQMLGRSVLTSESATVTVGSLPSRKFLRAHIHAPRKTNCSGSPNSQRLQLQFNSDTGGANAQYSFNYKLNDGAQAAAASADAIDFGQVTSGDDFAVVDIENRSTSRKLVTFSQVAGISASAAPDRIAGSGLYNNNTTAIGTVIFRPSGGGGLCLDSGTELVVFGSDL